MNISHKKKKILTFATNWVDFEGIILYEISQTEKDKYCVISHVESEKVELIETKNRMMVARAEE